MDASAVIDPPVAEPTAPALDATEIEAPPVAPAAPRARRPRKTKVKPRCADCFFLQNKLCALEEKKPCSTFRPAHPDGLRPPRQLSFAFRSDRAARFDQR